MLASIFVSSGLDAVQHPEGTVTRAERVTGPLASRLAVVPDDTATAVTLNGAVQVVAGSLLALGVLRRTAAVALIGSLVPTTLAGHRFWEEIDEQARTQLFTQFLKNLGLLGELVLVATQRTGPRAHDDDPGPCV